MATNYVRDQEGNTFIAASQRSDGSWRRAKRVKDGYIPQEEVPVYEAKAKKEKAPNTGLPPGITPEIWASMKAQQRNQRYNPNVINSKKEKPPQQPHAANVQENVSTEPVSAKAKQAKPKTKKQPQKQAIKAHSQNENVVLPKVEPSKVYSDANEWVTVSNKKGRKNKKNSLTDVQVDQNIIDDSYNQVSSNDPLKVSNDSGAGKTGKKKNKGPKMESTEKPKKDNSKKQSSKSAVETVITHESADSDGVQADPAKKLRNLKKRLREIEVLKTKDMSTLDKDQVQKVKRYKEIKKLVKQMEETL